MADHPFHGKWKSYSVSPYTYEVSDDGKFDLKIDQNGNFISGSHNQGSKNNPLQCVRISTSQITLIETKTPYATYDADLRADLYNGNVKVLAGTWELPLRARKKSGTGGKLPPGQNDGVWVATQP